MTTKSAKAEPTRDFFVSVLGKDISLIAAIIDLVDNSVDGARRLRPGSDASFEGLFIEIDTSADRFSIKDNCGGISVKTAETYAFRFGHPPSVRLPQYATGQFGIGMKRALFKLGNHFTLVSRTRNSSFSMDVHVDQWVKKPGPWQFDLEDVREKVKIAPSKVGTTITVDSLHPTIVGDLTNGARLSDLRTELTQRHMLSFHKGLAIKLNGHPLSVDPPSMIVSKEIVPAYTRFSLNGEAPIDVKLLCGVSKGPVREGGWSVFLNDRMVLLNDKTDLTGWGTRDEKRIPRYHGQYGRFRGYAFMSCPETTRLPWDTTKTGLDVDRPQYRAVASRMISLMEPVVRFLDDVSEEIAVVNEQQRDDPGPLVEALSASERSFFDVLDRLPKRTKIDRPFRRPAATFVKPPPTTQSIQFSRPRDQIDRMKKHFRVRSAYAAGEAAWDYVFEAEDL
jgi:Histidine kinase-, DNA gyrase B-, and HSP90-like ATPase